MDPLQVRLGGYAPQDSTHSRALDLIAARLRDKLGDRVDVSIEYNIMDSGRPASDLYKDVEAGETTLCFFSTSYLADRVPELGIIDLPYLFDSLAHAHACLDGPFGEALSERTRAATGLLPLGYWDGGFRHLTNKHRDIRTPADCRGLKIRLQPNWAHEQLFRALGCEPVLVDLKEGIERLMSGELDAQENPFANTVAYGVDRIHKHVTLTGHVYAGRGVYASAVQLRDWPDDAVQALRDAARAGIEQQRVEGEAKEVELQRHLSASGTRIIELTDEELDAFRQAARPVLDAARQQFGPELFDLVEQERERLK